MLKLQFTDGSQKGVWLIAPKQKLGTDRKNDLVLTAQDIGEFHAEIHVEGDNLRLEPLGGHACFINGTRVAGVTPLKLGDRIRLGSVELEVVDPRTLKIPAKPAAASPGKAGAGKGWTLVQQGGANNKSWPIQGTMVVGRATDCDISITYDRMSRKHAELKELGGALHVRDLGSANGTFVNDQRVNGEVRLKAGDKLRFDMMPFLIEGPRDDVNKTVVRQAIDLSAIQQPGKSAKASKQQKPSRPAPSRPTAPLGGSAGQSSGAEGGNGVLIAVVAGVLVVVAVAAWFFLR